MTRTADFGIAPDAYRLPAATRVGLIRLQVSDLERALVYYRDVLGFIATSSSARSVALSAADDPRPLVELHERAGARRVPQAGVLGLYHFAILLPDRASLGRFVTHVAKLGERVGAADHFVSESLYLWDPDGLGMEVYADRPRGEWRNRGRELVMGTEPLDLQSLARDGGSERWSGFPAGTTIGHMHLQVGDLTLARSFYHGALGFDLVVWTYPGALFVSAGGYHHHLGANTWAGAAARPPTDEDARLLEWQLVLPVHSEVQRAAASVEAAGHRVTSDGADRVLIDPWGTPLRLGHCRNERVTVRGLET
jgi:catechol 2,3-dioxygenase